MIEDHRLLSRFAEHGSEEAFKELTRRHVDLVYSVALRQVGYDEHFAEDVTQEVFCALARKAGSLNEEIVVGAWLCRSAHFVARNLMTRQKRRRSREKEAHKLYEIEKSSDAEIDWERARPILDEAISNLKEADRKAVWLRYFENRSFSEIGKRLQMSEDAARMRVKRALDKLCALAARRGITSSSAALAVAIGGQASAVAPAGMASFIASAAATSAAGVGGVTGTGLIIGFMNTTKGIYSMAAVVLLAVSGTSLYWNSESIEGQSEVVDDRKTELRRSKSSGNSDTTNHDDIEIAGDAEWLGLSEEERFEQYKRRLEPLIRQIVEREDDASYDGSAPRKLNAFLIEVFDSGDRRIAYRLVDTLPDQRDFRGLVQFFMEAVADRLDGDEIEGILRDIEVSPVFGGHIAYEIIKPLSKENPREAAAWAETLPESYIGPTLGRIAWDLEEHNETYGHYELDWLIRDEVRKVLVRLESMPDNESRISYEEIESLIMENPREAATKLAALPDGIPGLTLGYAFGEWREIDPNFGYDALELLSTLDESAKIDLPLMQVAMSFKDDPELMIELAEGIRGEEVMNMFYASAATEFLREQRYEDCLMMAKLVSENDPRGERLVGEALRMLEAQGNQKN